MREKLILARVVGIQRENRGYNHTFFRDNNNKTLKSIIVQNEVWHFRPPPPPPPPKLKLNLISQKCNFSRILTRNLKKWANFFQVAIRFHPGHPQPKMINTSFCALVGLLLTKLNHYFNVCIHINTGVCWVFIFLVFKLTLKMGDSAPLMTFCSLH